MAAPDAWPPGWFPDPTGRHDHRWWDGAAWTAHVADAGVAATDPLTTPPETGSDRGLPPVMTMPESRPGSDPVAIAALAVALGSLVLAFIPGFGLVAPIAAIVLAVLGRSRIRASGRRGDGIAISGLVVGIASLTLALIVTATTVLLLRGAGGELAGAVTEYVTCLETRSPAECQRAFQDSLERITE